MYFAHLLYYWHFILADLLREIFENCGLVDTVRLSKKGFCHIRFTEEKFVDNAIYLSGKSYSGICGVS